MDTPTTSTSTTVRLATGRRPAGRLLAAVLALVVGLVALGIGATPAGAAVPSATRVLGGIGYDQPGPQGQHRLIWAPTAADGDITAYQIEVWNGDKSQKLHIWNLVGTNPTPALTIGQQADGVVKQYRVRAKNADGWGTYGEYFPVKVIVGKDLARPFVDETQLIQRQLADFGVGGPVGFWPAFIDDPDSLAEFMDDMATHPSRANRAKVLRLYFAYFDRAAEPAGLDYWQDRLDAGTATLSNVSSFFAQSQEFKAIYGNTTDHQFVTLVYQNVLDRDPAADEVAYWTGSLAQGTTTRGKLMIGFSESPEGKALRQGDAVVADLWATMMREPASAQLVDVYSRFIEVEGDAGSLAAMFLPLNGYSAYFA